MWVILDESISHITADMTKHILGLETLLSSIARGEHAAAIRPDIAKKLQELKLSQTSVATIKYCSLRSPEYLSQAESSRYKIYVNLNGATRKLSQDNEWSISLEFIASNGMPNSAILTENINDAKIFEYCAIHYKIISKSNRLFKTHLISGGGADTPKVLENTITQKTNFVLCITDSDKLSPSDPENQTCRDCKSKIENSQWIAIHRHLDEREIENHIPISIIEDALDHPEFKNPRQKLYDLINLKFSQSQWKYLDLKEGTKLKKCLKNYSFWEHAISKAKNIGIASQECGNDSKCKETTKDNCKCLIAPGITDKLAEHVLNHLDKNSHHSTAKRVLSSINKDAWLETGEIICDWAACLPPQRL